MLSNHLDLVKVDTWLADPKKEPPSAFACAAWLMDKDSVDRTYEDIFRVAKRLAHLQYDSYSEFSRLKAADIDQGKRIAELIEQSKEDAELRQAFIGQARTSAELMRNATTRIMNAEAVARAADAFIQDPSSVNALFALEEAVNTWVGAKPS